MYPRGYDKAATAAAISNLVESTLKDNNKNKRVWGINQDRQAGITVY